MHKRARYCLLSRTVVGFENPGGLILLDSLFVCLLNPQITEGLKSPPALPLTTALSLALDGIEVGEHFLLSCVPGYIDRSAQAHFFMAQNHKGSVFLWWLIIPFEFERQIIFD